MQLVKKSERVLVCVTDTRKKEGKEVGRNERAETEINDRRKRDSDRRG